ncbi:MAG: 3-phosphoserine/phosphohydroxythreonine transaminase [Fuerstiella sp.]|jgi:phosphoserine aminotransferase|nr:3-phosphoserine/phosphohydroxythreonine transaminase [Fuerstiella sp.]MCP4511995.1 3-phosphoserine/phosphohydroxythreonine transaminase [Fuerstiella sp.]MDG2129688.1 3-phosphoserine/phosphohydroxythreonine transaminase [Fuerstiella sp.]
MSNRIWNFSAGPAVLPESVLEEAAQNLLSLGDTGVGICEHSHRGKPFVAVADEAESLCREIADIPDNYRVLFLQGGASLQFGMVPMNFLAKDQTADYLVTGAWARKALKEAKRFGNAHVACNSENANFNYIPSEMNYSDAPRYVHYASNNTIYGTQFRTEPTGFSSDAFLVRDASSEIFSRPIDIAKHGIIYAGAQKNLGPSGVTLVIIRDDLVEAGSHELTSMLQYRTHAGANSMFNTPPTSGIYLMMLVFRWIKEHGGLTGMQTRNEDKAGRLYEYLDNSSLFQATAEQDSRSLMNVTFVTGDADRDAAFISQAEAKGFSALKGHRSVGGMRASIYNAFPAEGVDALIEFMKEFEASA